MIIPGINAHTSYTNSVNSENSQTCPRLGVSNCRTLVRISIELNSKVPGVRVRITMVSAIYGLHESPRATLHSLKAIAMAPSDSDEILQRLEASLDFLVNENDDNPPAIRGVMAHTTDFRDDIQNVIQKIASDPANPDLQLERLLWFDDKNEKLDEACEEAKSAFRPYPITADGLISFVDPNNQLMDKPTQHRLVVSDEFAGTNYDRPAGDEMIMDDDEESVIGDVVIKADSWKRKITQTIKPWRIKQPDGKIVPTRSADDLLLTLNALFSRTKHGWLVADLLKLKKRRGSMLVHARTYEYQIKGDQRFEFLIQYLGVAAVCRKRLADSLNNVACLYLELDGNGEIFVTKASTYEGADFAAGAKIVDIPLDAKVVNEVGKPSQIVLKKTGKYYESKLLPLLAQRKKMATKIDLRKSNSDAKKFRFHFNVEMTGPLLVASSGDALIFQLDDFLNRFASTSLAEIRNGK